MRQRVAGFLSKFFFEILPATVASAVAGYVFGHVGITAPPPPAAQVMASPAGEEMFKMVRDDHEAFVDYLKKASESRQDASPAAQEAETRLKREEQAAAAAIRQAKEAEAKALAAARKVAARSGPQPQGAQGGQVTAKAGAPLQLAPAEAPLGQLAVARPVIAAPAPLPAQPTIIIGPAPQVAAVPEPHPPAAPHEAATSSGGWFSGGPPPRPPGTLPQNFSNTAEIGNGG